VRRHLYTPLNAVMRAAHRAQLAPLVVFEAPRVKRDPVTYADDRWLETFFRHAHFRVAAIVLFMTLTGARVTEACRLTPGDVDLDRAEAILRMTKSGKSRRLSLAPVLVEALRRCLEETVAEIDGTVRVFGYAQRYSVNQAIERVCAKAGLPYLSSHQVGRHTFAARLLRQGNSLKLVQDAGGWATIQIVSEVYGHLEQQQVDEAVRAAGAGVPALPPPKQRK
jgi:integrase